MLISSLSNSSSLSFRLPLANGIDAILCEGDIGAKKEELMGVRNEGRQNGKRQRTVGTSDCATGDNI